MSNGASCCCGLGFAENWGLGDFSPPGMPVAVEVIMEVQA
jgi:hypothetical protein